MSPGHRASNPAQLVKGPTEAEAGLCVTSVPRGWVGPGKASVLRDTWQGTRPPALTGGTEEPGWARSSEESRAGGRGCGVLGSGRSKQMVAEGTASLGWPVSEPTRHLARIGGAGTGADTTHGVPVCRSHVCVPSFVHLCSHTCLAVSVHVDVCVAGGSRSVRLNVLAYARGHVYTHVSVPVTLTSACLPVCAHPPGEAGRGHGGLALGHPRSQL